MAKELGADSGVRVRVASAEAMEDFAPESESAILGVLSATYSAAPYLAALAMDRVLEPGGAIKLVCGTGASPSYERTYTVGSIRTKNLLGAFAIAALTNQAGPFLHNIIQDRRLAVRTMASAAQYAQIFNSLQYDTHATASVVYPDKHTIFVGIKPGGSATMSARDLYEADAATLRAQLIEIDPRYYNDLD